MGKWAQYRRRGSNEPQPASPIAIFTEHGGADHTHAMTSTVSWCAWRITPSTSGTLTTVNAKCKATSPGGWSGQCMVYSDSAGVPGSLITAGGLQDSNLLPSSFADYAFPCGGVYVPTGNFYWVVLHMDATGGSPSLDVFVDTSATSGAAFKTSSNGSSWSTLYAGDAVHSDGLGTP